MTTENLNATTDLETATNITANLDLTITETQEKNLRQTGTIIKYLSGETDRNPENAFDRNDSTSACLKYVNEYLGRNLGETYYLTNIYLYITDVPTGTVKFFLDQKGYGFITDDETNEEYFVYVSGLIDKVNADDKVSFEVIEDKRGKKANEVKKI
jgi:CspA family cold shock protein